MGTEGLPFRWNRPPTASVKPTPSSSSMFLKEIETRAPEGMMKIAFKKLRDDGEAIPEILHLFRFKTRSTDHLILKMIIGRRFEFGKKKAQPASSPE